MEKVQKIKVSLHKKTTEVSLTCFKSLKWLQFYELLSESCICLIQTESSISGRGREKWEWFKSSVLVLNYLQLVCRAGRGMGLQNVVTVTSGSLTSLLEVYSFSPAHFCSLPPTLTLFYQCWVFSVPHIFAISWNRLLLTRKRCISVCLGTSDTFRKQKRMLGGRRGDVEG